MINHQTNIIQFQNFNYYVDNQYIFLFNLFINLIYIKQIKIVLQQISTEQLLKMTNAQFIHVAQFYQTILCFSVLVLIGQRLVMMCKDLDQKYLKARAKQFDDQIDWEKSFTREKQIIQQEQSEQRRAEEERNRIQQEKRKLQEERKKQIQENKNEQPPKQSNLRTSLIQNQLDKTDRKMIQDQQIPTRMSVQRKSLTDLRKSQQRLQISGQIKDELASKFSDSQSDQKKQSQRKPSTNSIKKSTLQQQKQKQIRNKTINLEGSQLNNIDIKKNDTQNDNNQQPQLNPQQELTQQDKLEKQYKDGQRIRYFIRVDSMFNQYIPILMSMLVMGMLCHSTYIFTMVCFFGYLFTSLLFNYANLLSKLKNQPTESSIFSKANKLIAGLFIIGLFLNFWFDEQF